jgi:pimeloyl-ACP methyl ester carboxylesterase
MYLDASQGRIHVDDGGKGGGLPLVFIHGNGANLTQWRAQLDYFRKTRRAVAIDLRGMGLSDAPANGEYTIDSMAGDVHDVVNALRFDRFVLVGHSFGGAVVARYAAANPDRVAATIYADSAGDMQVRQEAADRFLTALRMDKKAVVRKWFDPILENASEPVKAAVLRSVDLTSVEAFTGALEAMQSVKVVEAVNAFPGPKLAIVAEGSNPAALHVQVPSIPARTMGGVSHWLMMDRPEEFNRLVAVFLAEVEKN